MPLSCSSLSCVPVGRVYMQLSSRAFNCELSCSLVMVEGGGREKEMAPRTAESTSTAPNPITIICFAFIDPFYLFLSSYFYPRPVVN
jgi:hypothetical protein